MQQQHVTGADGDANLLTIIPYLNQSYFRFIICFLQSYPESLQSPRFQKTPTQIWANIFIDKVTTSSNDRQAFIHLHIMCKDKFQGWYIAPKSFLSNQANLLLVQYCVVYVALRHHCISSVMFNTNAVSALPGNLKCFSKNKISQ